MKQLSGLPAIFLCVSLFGLFPARLPGAPASVAASDAGEPIDFQRARAIRQKVEASETPTPEERAYVQRAMQERQKQKGKHPVGANQKVSPITTEGERYG